MHMTNATVTDSGRYTWGLH